MDQCHHGNPISSLSKSYNKKQMLALTKQSTNNRMMMQSEHFPLVELTITCRVTGIEEGGVVVHRRVWGLKVRRKRRFGGRRSRQSRFLSPSPIIELLPSIFLIVFSYVSLLLLLLSLHCIYLLNAWHCGPSPTNKDQSLTLIPMIRLLIRGALT